MADLTQFLLGGAPQSPAAYQQTLTLADLALQADQLNQQAGISRQLATRNFTTRTVPGITREAAGRNSFFSGGTVRHLNEASEDLSSQLGQLEFDLQRQLQEIVRRQYLTAIGIPV